MAAPVVVILAALPQTQCTRCGYPDCAGYAQALSVDEAPINRCPPGGAEGIVRLSAITALPIRPLDPQFGTEGPRALAVIDEAWCIGCTKCLDVCPTDAILGIHKRMHTVIDAHCTGCELCVPVCPVDCIAMEVTTPGRTGWEAWSQPQADHARRRYEARQARLARKKSNLSASTLAVGRLQQGAPADNHQGAAPAANGKDSELLASERKRAIVEAALARAKASSASRKPVKPG